MADPSVSVIVSSYNQPNSLRLVLAGFAAQQDLGFELIVADDGSSEETAHMVDSFGRSAPFSVRFITQEHEGFRKTRILNKAILIARGQQVVFCDGDCVPYRRNVSAYRSAWSATRFCVGWYVFPSLEQSRTLTPDSIANGIHETLSTAAERRYLLWRDVQHGWARLVGNRLSRPRIAGGNFAAPRDLLLRVNGFDESFCGFSGEDCDLRNRLRLLGMTGTSMCRKVVVCHLDHRLDSLEGKSRARPDRLLRRRGLERVEAAKGLSSLRTEPALLETSPNERLS